MTLQEQKNCSMISSKATVASRNSLHWSCKPLIRLRKILASRSPCGEVAARSAAGGVLKWAPTPPLSPPHKGTTRGRGTLWHRHGQTGLPNFSHAHLRSTAARYALALHRVADKKVPKGEGRRAVLAGQQRRRDAARTFDGPALAVRDHFLPDALLPGCRSLTHDESVAPLPPCATWSRRPPDGEALHIVVGLRRIELLAHHLEGLAGGVRRLEADLLHQLCRVGGEIDLLRHGLVVDVALDLPPALHLREDPDGERLPGERVEVDAVRIALHAAEAVRIGAGEDLLEHGDGLVQVVCRRDRLGDLLAVLLLAGERGGVDDRLEQRRIGVRHRGDELLRRRKRAARMAVPQLLRQHVDE